MVANWFSTLIVCLTLLSSQVEGNCPFGLWGKNCRRRCSSRCVGRWCEASSGMCKLGCVDRFYGDRCELRCWNCGGFGRCYRDGRCIYNCKAGWARPICLSNIDCGQPTPFTNMVVSGGRTHYGDQAMYRCVRGYTGVGSGTSTCQENGTWTRPVLVCSKASCKDEYSLCQESFVNCDAPGIRETCKKTCGVCEDTNAEPCEDPERWGWHCGEACSTACRERRCDRLSGHCLGECIFGHYGTACDLRCENCDGGGCFKNGTCRIGCIRKWRGPQCDQSHPVDSCRDQYPQECHQYVTMTLCDHPGITQACRHTCAACVDPVGPCGDPKRWGRHCDHLCNAACSGRRCHRMTGRCHGNCRDGLYGLACELHCENCMNGHCNRVGTCLSGCNPGWRGTRCDEND